MSYKLILVQTEQYGCECYDGCDCDPNLEMRDLTLGELAKTTDWQLKNDVKQLVMSVLESDDEELGQLLRQKGWVNIKEIEDKEQKLKAAKQYYMVEDRRSAYSQRLTPIDLNNLSQHIVRRLPDEKVQVVQAVTKTSLKKTLTDAQRKIYNAESARMKKEKEKRAKTAQARKDKKAAREVAKARKVLEEAGELK
tara:strand:+ start:1756 stop:2340 length:585 start_codon:yes stop_codon:yes gene_type:complete